MGDNVDEGSDAGQKRSADDDDDGAYYKRWASKVPKLHGYCRASVSDEESDDDGVAAAATTVTATTVVGTITKQDADDMAIVKDRMRRRRRLAMGMDPTDTQEEVITTGESAARQEVSQSHHNTSAELSHMEAGDDVRPPTSPTNTLEQKKPTPKVATEVDSPIQLTAPLRSPPDHKNKQGKRSADVDTKSHNSTNVVAQSKKQKSTTDLISKPPAVAANPLNTPGKAVGNIREKRFPEELMEILSNDKLSDIITWRPDGQGFVILQEKRFAEEVMPKYFERKCQFSSFIRKLNRWEFVRMVSPEGPYYAHHLFQKENPRRCQNIKIPGRKSKMLADEDDDLPGKAVDSDDPNKIRKKRFSEKLMEVLSNDKLSDIITWLPDGQGFVILQKERFANEIMPYYLDMQPMYRNFADYMRRCAFGRLPCRGRHLSCYYHPLFQKGKPRLCREIRFKRSTTQAERLSNVPADLTPPVWDDLGPKAHQPQPKKPQHSNSQKKMASQPYPRKRKSKRGPANGRSGTRSSRRTRRTTSTIAGSSSAMMIEKTDDQSQPTQQAGLPCITHPPDCKCPPGVRGDPPGVRGDGQPHPHPYSHGRQVSPGPYSTTVSQHRPTWKNLEADRKDDTTAQPTHGPSWNTPGNFSTAWLTNDAVYDSNASTDGAWHGCLDPCDYARNNSWNVFHDGSWNGTRWYNAMHDAESHEIQQNPTLSDEAQQPESNEIQQRALDEGELPESGEGQQPKFVKFKTPGVTEMQLSGVKRVPPTDSDPNQQQQHEHRQQQEGTSVDTVDENANFAHVLDTDTKEWAQQKPTPEHKVAASDTFSLPSYRGKQPSTHPLVEHVVDLSTLLEQQQEQLKERDGFLNQSCVPDPSYLVKQHSAHSLPFEVVVDPSMPMTLQQRQQQEQEEQHLRQQQQQQGQQHSRLDLVRPTPNVRCRDGTLYPSETAQEVPGQVDQQLQPIPNADNAAAAGGVRLSLIRDYSASLCVFGIGADDPTPAADKRVDVVAGNHQLHRDQLANLLAMNGAQSVIHLTETGGENDSEPQPNTLKDAPEGEDDIITGNDSGTDRDGNGRRGEKGDDIHCVRSSASNSGPDTRGFHDALSDFNMQDESDSTQSAGRRDEDDGPSLLENLFGGLKSLFGWR